MVGAISRGLTMKDMDNLTIGQLVDYCIEYNNIQSNTKDYKDDYYDSERIIIATQREFDSF